MSHRNNSTLSLSLNSIAREAIFNFNISLKSLFYGQIISVLKLYAWILSYSVEILLNVLASLCMAEFSATYLCQNNASIKWKIMPRLTVCLFCFRFLVNCLNMHPNVLVNKMLSTKIFFYAISWCVYWRALIIATSAQFQGVFSNENSKSTTCIDTFHPVYSPNSMYMYTLQYVTLISTHILQYLALIFHSIRVMYIS